MQITLDFIQFFDLLSFTTAFVLGLLFIFKSPKANVYLGIFLFSLGLEVFQVFCATIAEYNTFSVETSSLVSLPSLVFLLFYVQHNIYGCITKKSWGLLIIGVVLTVLTPSIIGESDAIFLRIIDYIFNLFIILYIFKMLFKHKKSVINYYSELELKTLSWIKTILYIYLGFYLLWITEDIVSLFNQELPEIFAQISTIATCGLIYWIGYKGMAQPEIFNQTLYKEIRIPEEIKEVSIIPKEELKYNEKDKLEFTNIKEKIIVKKLYTNPDLNLRTLAIDLGIKEKELSRIINTQTNFYQLINSFRVTEFKVLIQSPKASQLSLLGLAYESGFSSKSTFYSTFKKLEGMTPKQYETKLKSE